MTQSKKKCIIRDGNRHAKRNGKRCTLEEGTQSMVLKLLPLRDENGRYIPYCDFVAHRGISLGTCTCELNKCAHYHKLYITAQTRVYENKGKQI